MCWKNVCLVLIFLFLPGIVSAKERASGPDSPTSALGNEGAKTADWLYRGLEINYALLNAADLATTIYGLRRGAKETNPFARPFVRSTPGVILVKGGLTFGVLWALRRTREKNKGLAFATLGVLNVIYGVVVRNNIGVVVKLN